MGRTATSPATAPEWIDGYYWSDDGLRLHWRELPAGPDVPADRPALLCIPGLTRTAADFEALGARHGGRWRIIAVDLRGRGDSAWPRDSLSYVPLSYLHDLGLLIAAAGIGGFIAVGSSVGGVLAMLLTIGHRGQIAGAILNDIGPVIEPDGLRRMRANVGRQANWPTWVHAARDLAARNADIYPGWTLRDWLGFAKRLCKLNPAGRIVFDYDPRIAEAFRLPNGDAGADLWTAFAALQGVPVLSLRGALSDVLSRETQAEMARRLPEMTVVNVPGVGHAPTLDEPAASKAVDAWLDRALRGETT